MNSGTTFTVSVLRCKKTRQVLLLEAGKDFVDMLISFLVLPIGTILHTLSNGPGGGKPLGGISGILASVHHMDSSLLHAGMSHLVKPMPAAIGNGGATGLLKDLKHSPSKQILQLLPTMYNGCHSSDDCTNISLNYGSRCQKHGGYSYLRILHVVSGELEPLAEKIVRTLNFPDDKYSVSPKREGFVSGNITYMVTDSLEIMPSTSIRNIELFNKLKVVTLADLESQDVSVDITQVIQLLRSALTSSTCLNEVFGRK